jgi:hypothetical protein
MAVDPELRDHQRWLGYLQPVGLVVSAAVLKAAGAYPNESIAERQEVLRQLAEVDRPETPPRLLDFPALARDFFEWPIDEVLAGTEGGPPLPDGLEVALPEYCETLRPHFALLDYDKRDQKLLLVQVHPAGMDLDNAAPAAEAGRGWHASPQARFERLLRDTGVPAGLLLNGDCVRLVYAPRGESAGHVTFPVEGMLEVAGRPICAALYMLLSVDRLFTVETKKRLPAILADSRKYQNEVSTRLAEQVLGALYELVRGFQAADEFSKGELLREVLRESPNEVYGGLLATLLRLVFVLYAEDRGLISTDPVYVEGYSVGGLFAKLREDEARYPDTMDQRFGAWARLLVLFRLLHDGAAHGPFHLPQRHGRLFEPDTYTFLEGRPLGSVHEPGDRIVPPRVPDSVVWRVLKALLVLDGERLSYRALDVEQIGSVYEAMMGFELHVARGPSIAVRPDHVVVDLPELLSLPAAERAKRLKDEARCDLTGPALEALKKANTPEDAVAALGKKVSQRTPRLLPAGSITLQPTEERRRSGSHYTPRSLTQPIVKTTLDPILQALGPKPTPEQILGLKVCDHAMGSGAFLVETCRYLGEALVKAWDDHAATPQIPPDEDPLLHARRLVAQRCLYGVDKNPFAVDLAKLSLWLATLAKDHPFTFLDDSLRHGDSLVGLSPDQISRFHWEASGQIPLVGDAVREAQERAIAKRAEIENLNDDDVDRQMALLAEAEAAVADVRLAGDLVIAAFFWASKDKEREALRKLYETLYLAALSGGVNRGEAEQIAASLREGAKPLFPFHWELAFPEVFARENPGFDAFVGNPPFAGKNTLVASTRDAYPKWLLATNEESHGNADVVAFFYRRAFEKLRTDGAFGLIATNTIAQGDTRGTGLRHICTHDGTIFNARRRVKWPGMAAVIVSVVHVKKGVVCGPFRLDDREAARITAFLFHDGGNDDPKPLKENEGKSFIGSYVLGMGFTFDDTNPEATSIAEMRRLIEKDPRNAERIFPYLGGEELNASPTHANHRFVINFGQMTEEEARKWPDLMGIVERKVRPARLKDNRASYRRWWWQFAEKRSELSVAAHNLDRVLAIARTSRSAAFTFAFPATVFSENVVVFPFEQCSALTCLNSRPHEIWIRAFSNTLKDDLQYSPSACFEPFPFPASWRELPVLESVGRGFYDFRAALMIRNNEGLTKTYNRFHEPDETSPDIHRLRALHDEMDRAVLDAYGWTDLRPTCAFILDYEDEETEDDDSARARKRKKPWRYRWPDDIRDEVLSRLLALNSAHAATDRPGRTPRSGASIETSSTTMATESRRNR